MHAYRLVLGLEIGGKRGGRGGRREVKISKKLHTVVHVAPLLFIQCNIYTFITHLIFRVHFFPIRKVWNNFPYFTSGYFSDQLRMRVKVRN